MDTEGQTTHHEPWNKGKIVGQKGKRPAIPPWLGIGVGCR